MAKRFKITKKAFIEAVKKGWETLEFATDDFWTFKNGRFTDKRNQARCGCAIGAAAYALNMDPDDVFPGRRELGHQIVTLNDQSTTKEEALKAISEMKWGEFK